MQVGCRLLSVNGADVTKQSKKAVTALFKAAGTQLTIVRLPQSYATHGSTSLEFAILGVHPDPSIRKAGF